eukprot:1582937-Pyramimonas_sp.AAC.1
MSSEWRPWSPESKLKRRQEPRGRFNSGRSPLQAFGAVTSRPFKALSIHPSLDRGTITLPIPVHRSRMHSTG